MHFAHVLHQASSVRVYALLHADAMRSNVTLGIGNYTGSKNTPAPYSFIIIHSEPGLNYSTRLGEYNRTWGGVWPNPCSPRMCKAHNAIAHMMLASYTLFAKTQLASLA